MVARTNELKMAKLEAEALRMKAFEEKVKRTMAELPAYLKEESKKYEAEYKANHPLTSMPEVREFLTSQKTFDFVFALVFMFCEWLDGMEKRNAGAKGKPATEEGPTPLPSQDNQNLDEEELRRRTQLLLVHDVVETESRITLEAAATKLGVSPERLKPILPQIVEGLDLRLGGFDGPFSVYHRAWKY
jgi:hypothetical protein